MPIPAVGRPPGSSGPSSRRAFVFHQCAVWPVPHVWIASRGQRRARASNFSCTCPKPLPGNRSASGVRKSGRSKSPRLGTVANCAAGTARHRRGISSGEPDTRLTSRSHCLIFLPLPMGRVVAAALGQWADGLGLRPSHEASRPPRRRVCRAGPPESAAAPPIPAPTEPC